MLFSFSAENNVLRVTPWCPPPHSPVGFPVEPQSSEVRVIFWFSDTSLRLWSRPPTPPCPSEPGTQAMAQPCCTGRAPGLPRRFSSRNGRNPTVSGPTVQSAGIENSPFRKCCHLRSLGGDGGSHGEYGMSPDSAFRVAGFRRDQGVNFVLPFQGLGGY